MRAGIPRRAVLGGIVAVAAGAALPARTATPASALRAILLGTQGGPNFNLTRGAPDLLSRLAKALWSSAMASMPSKAPDLIRWVR